MRVIFNNRDETFKRQQLRAEMPVAERLLWKQLRNEALGVKFRLAAMSLIFVAYRCSRPSKMTQLLHQVSELT